MILVRSSSIGYLLAMLVVAVLITGAGVYHVYTVQQELAVRRQIYVGIVDHRGHVANKQKLSRDLAELKEMSRIELRAQVFGLHLPDGDRLIVVDDGGKGK